MDIILQERVNNLGKIGDVVTVKAGYARNFLLPYGKAVVANEDNKALVESKREGLEAKEAAVLAEAQKRADVLATLSHVEITVRCSEEGKLYGSVGAAEVVTALTEKGQTIAKDEVLLVESIRELGEHTVSIRFHLDLVVPFMVKVISDNEEINEMYQADQSEEGEGFDPFDIDVDSSVGFDAEAESAE